jgi:hypothetical protein
MGHRLPRHPQGTLGRLPLVQPRPDRTETERNRGRCPRLFTASTT